MSLFSPDVSVDNAVVLDPSSTVSVSNFPATQPVSGTVSVGNFPATQPVSIAASVAVTGPLTDTQLRATPVPISGTVTTSPVSSSTSTVVQVVVSATTNTTIKAANAGRKQLIIFAPKSTIYVKLGVGASATSFTYVGASANSVLEIDVWQGQVDVFSTVAQTVNVTELV